jgi:hypothetical protein
VKLNYRIITFEDFDQPAKTQQFSKKISESVNVEIVLTSERTSRSFLLESNPIHFRGFRWSALMYLITAAFKNIY